MSLIKTNGSEWSGKHGGDVFSRDKSGQHITAAPRKTSKQPTTDQDWQRKWYAGKKRAEYHGFFPQPDDMKEPITPAAYVYGLGHLRWLKFGTFGEPEETDIIYEGSAYDQIVFWIDGNWSWISLITGITRDIAITLMCKWYWVAHVISNGQHEAAFAHATGRMVWLRNYTATSGTGILVPFIVAGTILAVYVYAEEVTAAERHIHTFGATEVLIYYNRVVYWGRIVTRYTRQMCTLLSGPALLYPATVRNVHEEPPAGMTHNWEPSDFFQEIKTKVTHWDVYTWEHMETRYIGDAYPVAANTYRMNLDPWWYQLAGIPIGYEAGPDPFSYLEDIYTPSF